MSQKDICNCRWFRAWILVPYSRRNTTDTRTPVTNDFPRRFCPKDCSDGRQPKLRLGKDLLRSIDSPDLSIDTPLLIVVSSLRRGNQAVYLACYCCTVVYLTLALLTSLVADNAAAPRVAKREPPELRFWAS